MYAGNCTSKWQFPNCKQTTSDGISLDGAKPAKKYQVFIIYKA